MITETTDRAVEALVERFAKFCSEEYSVKVDRSAEIMDYVLGRTEQMPKMAANSVHYAYRTIDVLEKLGKKDDSDIFFRAGALLMHLESQLSRKYMWYRNSFSICLGYDAAAFGLGGRSKLGSRRIDTLSKRLASIHKFAGEKAIEDEIKSKISNCKFDNKNIGSEHEIVNMLLLVKLYASLDTGNIHEFKSERLTNTLPELLQAVLYGRQDELRAVLCGALEPIIVQQGHTKDNLSAAELTPEFIQEKRTKATAEFYPNSSLNPKDKLSSNEFHKTTLLLHSALLFVMNVHGSKQNLLNEADEIGRLLLESVRMLHEVYPFEVREYLLGLDNRAKQKDELLEGIVPLNEPFGLIDTLRNEMESYTLFWNMMQSAVLQDYKQTARAYEMMRSPYKKAFVHKVMLDHGAELTTAEGTLEQSVFAVLRHHSEGSKLGLGLARYLEGESTFEDYWQEQTNRSLFFHRDRDKRRGTLLNSVTFLPMESEAFRRFVILMTRPEINTLDLVSDLYRSFAFSGEKVLHMYGNDPEVDRDRLLSALLELNGMKDYYYKSMPQDEYRRIIEQHLEQAATKYKNLPTDSRLTVLDIAFENNEKLTTNQLGDFIRAGLLDTSKKANAAALAEFNRTADKALYLSIYRAEKKAAVKELVLDSLRSLPDGKAAYLELLEEEKSADWKSLIQILLDTADLDPSHAHAALAEQADGKKIARLSWLSILDLPQLTDKSGQKLDDRIKQYILLQSMDHTAGPNERLNELRTYAGEESLARFAVELIQLWLQNEAPAKEKWVLFVGALFGDRELVRVLAPQIKLWTENSRGAMAAEAVKVLAYLKEPAALMTIDTIKRTVKNRQVKGAAEEALELAAENQGLTPEQLEDRLVTSLGFDAKGTQQLSYGDRSFQVKVSRELEVVVLNEETGKALKSLPAPNQKDNAELAAKSKAQFTQLKKDLKTMVSLQALRLEESLSRQRQWSTEEWTALFVQNVIMQKFAVGLVWGVYGSEGLQETFRYMEDGTFNTVDEDEYELPADALIGLVHPLELEQSILEGWKSQLNDYEIKQPFAQLDRDIHLVEEQDLKSQQYDRLPEEELSPTAFPKALEKYGWYKGMAQDGGWYHEFYKEYGNWIAELRFSGTSITYYEGLDQITLESVHFYENKQDKYHYYSNNPGLALGTVPGRIYSETIYDILRAAGR